MARAKYYLFTVNNPVDRDIPTLDNGITFIVYQEEVGETGTRHIQGYLGLDERCRVINLKERYPWLSRAHLEVRRGTHKQALDYCTKEATRVSAPVYLGTMPSCGGSATSLQAACDVLRSGEKLCNVNNDTVFVKHHRGLQALRAQVLRASSASWRVIKVLIIYGLTGLGKTRWAYERYGVQNVFRLTQPVGAQLWFDGYDGESCVIIDDFTGWIKYRYLLTLLDGYPVDLPVKGAVVPALFTTVVITSNVPYEAWYPNHDVSPLRRRISRIIQVHEPLDFTSGAPDLMSEDECAGDCNEFIDGSTCDVPDVPGTGDPDWHVNGNTLMQNDIDGQDEADQHWIDWRAQLPSPQWDV